MTSRQTAADALGGPEGRTVGTSNPARSDGEAKAHCYVSRPDYEFPIHRGTLFNFPRRALAQHLTEMTGVESVAGPY